MTTAARPTETTEVVLRLSAVSLDVPSGRDRIPLLEEIDLEVRRGECVAIVGESGSGKSMTLRTISRLLPPGARTSGAVELGGTRMDGLGARRLREIRRTRVGTIFQDPRSAINPIQRIGDFMLEPIHDAHGDVAAGRDRALDLLRRMGITDPERRMRQYPFELSGGLLQRVMIASVLLADPDVVLADEPTTALDVTTQSDVLAITEELRRERGLAMVFVTHDLDLALAICDRVLVLYAGRLLEVADAEDLRRSAHHPYTVGLLGSRPPLERRLDLLPAIEGSPIAASQVGRGCPFVARCPIHTDICGETMPAPTPVGDGWVRCHHAEVPDPADARA